MSRFKVGDKVRVREGLSANVQYGDVYFVKSMNKFKGIETEIASTDYYGSYKLKECAGGYIFTDEMLEPVEEIETEIEKGDLVEITKGVLKGAKGRYYARLPYSDKMRIEIKEGYITIDPSCVKLIKKEKKREEGMCEIISFAGKCKYIIEGDKTTIILPNGIKGSVKLYKGDKYDRLLGLELAYYKAKLNEAIKKVKPI